MHAELGDDSSGGTSDVATPALPRTDGSVDTLDDAAPVDEDDTTESADADRRDDPEREPSSAEALSGPDERAEPGGRDGDGDENEVESGAESGAGDESEAESVESGSGEVDDGEPSAVDDDEGDVAVESDPESDGESGAGAELPGRRPGATSVGADIDHRPAPDREEAAAALASRVLARGVPGLADREPRDLDLRSDLDVRVDPEPPVVGPVTVGVSAARPLGTRPAARRRNQLIGFLGLLLVALLAWLVTRPAPGPDQGVARDVPPVTTVPAAPTTTEPGPALVEAESTDVTVPADAVTTEIVLVNRGGRPGDFELLTEPEGAVLVGQRSGTLQPGERRIITVTADRLDGPASDWATTITLLGSGADGPRAIRVAIRG